MRNACGSKVHMKSILAIGECGTMENVYKASMVAMMAGSDFIKTSTGKESVNATLTVGLVMIRAIQDFMRRTNRKIGLKPAGGVRTVNDAIAWMFLLKNTLGDEWLQPTLFRFGASGLLDNIVDVVTAELDNITSILTACDDNNSNETQFESQQKIRDKIIKKYLDPKLTVYEQVLNYRQKKLKV